MLKGEDWYLSELAPDFTGRIAIERGDLGWELTCEAFEVMSARAARDLG